MPLAYHAPWYDGSMAADEPEEAESHATGEWLILALYGFGIGLNVYIIVDQMTDGRLTRECSLRWQRFRGAVAEKLRREQAIKRDESKVVWEAINIVEGRETEHGE